MYDIIHMWFSIIVMSLYVYFYVKKERKKKEERQKEKDRKEQEKEKIKSLTKMILKEMQKKSDVDQENFKCYCKGRFSAISSMLEDKVDNFIYLLPEKDSKYKSHYYKINIDFKKESCRVELMRRGN